MKSLISIFLTFSFFTLQAQETIVSIENQYTYDEENTSEPIYFKDVNNKLNKFTGNWIFDDGTHYLKLIITKEIHQSKGYLRYNDPNFEDFLLVKLIYKLNDVEIYNTTSVLSRYSLIYGNLIENNSKIELIYREPTNSCERHKKADLTLEFISDGILGQNGSLPSGTLNWKRVNSLSRVSPFKECPDGTIIDTSEFAIPAELTLERE